ncbi:hypothetical protein HDU87_007677 [Geranomyces variabilis]|uniref:Nascent polypeptide-associated complex subunit alpha-like UBA domain-containing protein n=1 Tax=Geranomyces variabilis TaxID=109894 RepID=A0AAD5TFD5_9FUNG|nr:hypothetical protein HDU87_007677 [Geranomyces variabilis]
MSEEATKPIAPEPAEDVEEQEAVETGVRGQANKDMQNVSGFDADDKGANVDADKLGKAMSFLSEASQQQKDQKSARDKELAKVTIGKEDLELVASEFQITKAQAEVALRENKGDVRNTLRKLVSVA